MNRTCCFSLTCEAVPADHLPLTLLSDVENLIRVFSDGDVGAACRDVGDRFVSGVVLQTPQMNAGSSSRGRNHHVVIKDERSDGRI